MGRLETAIAKVRDGSSLCWAFYEPEHPHREIELVEVRLNARPEPWQASSPPPDGPSPVCNWGDTLFLRRRQPLERSTVEAMLVEVLQIAAPNGMQLHSWLHDQAIG
jgi:hypothetical protein